MLWQPEVMRHVRIPTERPARISVSNRSPTMTIRCRSPEWPCCRSSSMAGSIMYLPPMLPPLPQQKIASLPCGYINLRIISANMPGPGSGNIMPGWLGSTEGLKASSAVYVNCAPCDSSIDAALTTSKLQSEKPPPVISPSDESSELWLVLCEMTRQGFSLKSSAPSNASSQDSSASSGSSAISPSVKKATHTRLTLREQAE
eukprot:scaffold43097_cov62-Phaeocystis_antarctica.AAC.6